MIIKLPDEIQLLIGIKERSDLVKFFFFFFFLVRSRNGLNCRFQKVAKVKGGGRGGGRGEGGGGGYGDGIG